MFTRKTLALWIMTATVFFGGFASSDARAISSVATSAPGVTQTISASPTASNHLNVVETKARKKSKKSTSPSQSVTVYITDTGHKYHRSGCRYLSKSKIAISLKDAKASGYTACKVCKP